MPGISRMCIVLAVGAMVLGATSVASAAPDWRGSAAFQKCVDQANGNDPAMAACGQDEFAREDKLLNEAYAARLKGADEPLKSAVKKSQRAWLAARDPTCEAEGAVNSGGTMENVTYTSCEARMTHERVDWLKGLDQ